MRHSRYAFLAFGLVLTATVTARADDRTTPRSLVEKAIGAQGGKAKLAKFTASTARFKGKFHGLGEATDFTGELSTQGADQHKMVIELEAGGAKIRITEVLDRTRGWIKTGDDTEEMDKADLARAKSEAYSEWVATLLPLEDKGFELAPLGEITIEKRPAVGVRVSKKGQADVNLYFDKKTNLLVKTETRIKDENEQEVTEETLLSDYREVQGTKQAMRFTTRHDGKVYLEGEVTELKLVEKLADSVFAKP
jgi:hypothetical protein